MREERLVKSSFIITITLLEKTINEDDTISYKVIDQKNDTMKAKEFYSSIYEDKIKGVDHRVEIVYAKPENFQINVIYVLADGTRMWVWVEKDPEITPEEAQAINDAAAGEAEVVEMESN